MKTLFIGGPNDGKRELWPHHGGFIQTAVRDMPPTLPAPSQLSVGFTTHTYTLKQYNTTSGQLQVAVHSSIPDLMEQLVKGYRYHRAPRYQLTRRKLSKSFNQLKALAS